MSVKKHLIAYLSVSTFLLIAVLALFSTVFAPEAEIEIVHFSKEQGNCYIAVIPEPWNKKLCPDNRGGSVGVLYENGKPLGPAHTAHADIRQMGKGRFSHWGDGIYFSTSDNTDPTYNGRKYLFKYATSTNFDLFIPLVLLQIYLLYFLYCNHIERGFVPDQALLSRRSAPGNKLFFSLNRSQILALLGSLVVIALALRWLLPLIDTYYLYSFEADSSSTIEHTRAFMTFFRSWDTNALPPLSAYPPYFDGQYLLFSLGGILVNLLKVFHVLDSKLLPTEQSVIIYAIRHINTAAYIASSVFFFLTARLISRNNLISFLLSLIFILNPQFMSIGLTRIDAIIIFFWSMVLYASVMIVNNKTGAGANIFLGLALAGLVSTKITSFTFCFVPAVAIILATQRDNYGKRNFSIFFGVFVLSLSLLSFRYLLHAGGILANFVSKIRDVYQWQEIMSKKPFFFYNWDIFLHYKFGGAFLVLSGTALFVSLVAFARRREEDILLIVSSLVWFSLLGIPALKYQRGGYHLVPLYLFIIAIASRYVLSLAFINARRGGKLLATAIIAIALSFTIFNVWSQYREIALDANHQAESIRVTRIEAREWFINHVPTKTRIATFHKSEAASPPILDLGYDFSPYFMNIPYLDRVGCATFYPPDVKKVGTKCDVIYYTDDMRNNFIGRLRSYGLYDVANKWEQYLSDLEQQYQLVEFKSPYNNYGITQLKIIIVNKNSLLSQIGDR